MQTTLPADLYNVHLPKLHMYANHNMKMGGNIALAANILQKELKKKKILNLQTLKTFQNYLYKPLNM